MGKNMEIEQDVDSNSSHQKAVLSSTVVIAGPSSLDLATNISIAMGVSLICPELRVFSDGESKIRRSPCIRETRPYRRHGRLAAPPAGRGMD